MSTERDLVVDYLLDAKRHLDTWDEYLESGPDVSDQEDISYAQAQSHVAVLENLLAMIDGKKYSLPWSDDLPPEGEFDCSTCHGTGIGQQGYPDTSRCHVCGGTGIVKTKEDWDA